MTIRYLIISILFIAISFFIGYSINPYGAHEDMKNQMVTIILPDGTGHSGTRSDTVYIDDYMQRYLELHPCAPCVPSINLKYLSEVHQLAYMQGVNECIANANARRSFTCSDLVKTLQYKKDSVFVLNVFKK